MLPPPALTYVIDGYVIDGYVIDGYVIDGYVIDGYVTDTDKTDSYVIDRFEDPGWAVLEDAAGRTFPVPRFWLPVAAGEGDVLRLVTGTGRDQPDGSGRRHGLRFRLDLDETHTRKERARRLRESLPPGPVEDLDLGRDLGRDPERDR